MPTKTPTPATNTTTKCYLFTLIISIGLLLSSKPLSAANYTLDTQGAHAFIQFRIKHLGYSWLWGRFNTFSGHFSFDETKPEATQISIQIDMNSIDSNHAERDKHLREEKFFDVQKFPTAEFTSKTVTLLTDNTAKLTGSLTLKGITKDIILDVESIGGGPDPWGGYRQGFEGRTQIKLKDFGIDYDLGPASQVAEIFLSIEGIRQK